MKVYGLRVSVIIVAFLLGIIFFWGMNKYYNVYNLEKPLTEKLEAAADVKAYEIEKSGSTYVITVTINETPDLRKSYRNIYKSVSEVVRGHEFKIILKDNHSEELEDAYYRSQYILYEAIARGNFKEMAEQIKDEASSIGAGAKVYVDEEYVYIHLAKDGRYLNCVVPRSLGGNAFNNKLALGGEVDWLRRLV